jgi:hypothetical protein
MIRKIWNKRSRYFYAAIFFIWLMTLVDSKALGQLGDVLRIGFLSLALYCAGISLNIIKPVHEKWIENL